MVERLEPFRKIRVSEKICVQLDKMKADEGHRGSFTAFVEDLLKKSVAGTVDFRSIPGDLSTVDYVEQLQSRILEIFKTQQHRIMAEVASEVGRKLKDESSHIQVKAHRPIEDNREQRRKAS